PSIDTLSLHDALPIYRAFTIYLMHSRLTEDQVAELAEWVHARGHRLEQVKVNEDCFAGAPVLFHYTVEMYYRLLAWKFLPGHLRSEEHTSELQSRDNL